MCIYALYYIIILKCLMVMVGSGGCVGWRSSCPREFPPISFLSQNLRGRLSCTVPPCWELALCNPMLLVAASKMSMSGMSCDHLLVQPGQRISLLIRKGNYISTTGCGLSWYGCVLPCTSYHGNTEEMHLHIAASTLLTLCVCACNYV